jgi:hypothetical protein
LAAPVDHRGGPARDVVRGRPPPWRTERPAPEGLPVATVEQCAQALDTLAARLAEREPSDSRRSLDRSLACVIRDLDVVFAGRLREGRLDDIHRLPAGDRPKAQVTLTLTGDDLLRLVDGHLNMAAAWATGKVKVDAGIRDMVKLRTFF